MGKRKRENREGGGMLMEIEEGVGKGQWWEVAYNGSEYLINF